MKTTTMIFVGLSYGFAYKCGLINIGIEGQLYMGGLFSAIAGIYLKLPMALHILVCLAAGFIGGAFWGGIVGWLKNRFKASEMITTVMMNYIAIYIVQYMVNGPIKEEKGTYPQSENILESAQLPLLVPKTQLTIGILIAVAAIIFYIIYWKRTSAGFEMSVVGANEQVAAYAGMPVKKWLWWQCLCPVVLEDLQEAWKFLVYSIRLWMVCQQDTDLMELPFPYLEITVESEFSFHPCYSEL